MHTYLNPDEVQAMVTLRHQQLTRAYQNACLHGADDGQRLGRFCGWLADRVWRFANRRRINSQPIELVHGRATEQKGVCSRKPP